MKRFIAPILILFTATFVMLGLSEVTRRAGYAQGVVSQPLGAGAASPVAVSPTPENVAVNSEIVKDAAAHPTTAPQTIGDTYKKSGLVIAIVLAAAIFVTGLSARAKQGSFLDRGKLPAYLMAGSAVLTSLYLGLTHEIPWSAVMAAIGTASGVLIHPDPPRKESKTS